MTQFAYKAVALQASGGGLVSGRAEATDERSLRDDLRKRGLVAVEVRPVRLADAVRGALAGDRVRRGDAAWFFQTLRTLLAGAVPIEAAMATMQDLSPSPRVRRVCGDVREKLRAGASLAEAVEAAPGLSTPQHRALLRAGHESGRLAHVVGLIDTNIQTMSRLRRTITGRLIYPAILFVAAVGAVWFLAVFVIPKFAATLEALGGELPLSTRATLWMARVMVWLGPVLVCAGVLAWLGRRRLISEGLRAAWSMRVLRLPVVGPMVWHGQAAVVADTLATMIEGGGDVLAGLGQAEEVVSSPAMAQRVASARRWVREGTDVGEAFAKERVFPPLVSAVLSAGIKGGDLVGGLRACTKACVEKQERSAERLLVLMEPGVILVMAGAVGWVVYALVMGMLAMSDLRGL
jgi:general secretion pathway protein F